MEKLQHPHVLGAIAYKEKRQLIPGQTHDLLISEYAEHGSLWDVVKHSKEQLKISVIRGFVHHILLGLEYLHSIDICHRDLKLENIFVFRDHVLKLGDFGFAMDVKEGK